MREFFKGWRRKMGCVTLAVTCVFMGVWVRSQFILDSIIVHLGHDEGTMDSQNGNLALVYSWNIPCKRFDYRWRAPKLTEDAINSDSFSHSLGFGYDEDSMWMRVGDLEEPQLVRLRYLRMPYWSIVLPLTLLSAYLLLVKPRVSKPKSALEPDGA